MSRDRVGGRRVLVYAALAVVLAAQAFLGLWGIADHWTRGHNGWNGAAYHNGARNTLRWGELFPLQYGTANVPPKKEQLYTHAPLGLHLHDVASLALFGDRELSIRLVAAAWSFAAVCMLFGVVRRLWSDLHGLLASAVYVALPINAVYTNMANHSAGFIFWALLTTYLYVRSRQHGAWRWPEFLAFLGAFTMAAMWDWPAYYVAVVIATHWLASERGASTSWRWLSFCGWVAVLFVGHFALVWLSTDGVGELTDAFNARRSLSWARFKTHLGVVPEVMFTWPILGLCGGWLVAWLARTARGTSAPRDLVPLAFLVAALIHYATFRWSAVVHSYWAWPALPFVAIAVATATIAMGRAIEARLRSALLHKITESSASVAASAAAVVLMAALLAPLAIRDAQIVPTGRHVGGSMWFFTPVRGAIDVYDSGRPELRFAKQVRAWTDRNTGVQLHPSLKSRRLEPRFDITLDRATHRWTPVPRPQLDDRQGTNGWVFVAPTNELSKTERVALAAKYPYREYDEYLMVDLRVEQRNIEIWQTTPGKMTPCWWLFHASSEPPVVARRSPEREASLRASVGRHHAD